MSAGPLPISCSACRLVTAKPSACHSEPSTNEVRNRTCKKHPHTVHVTRSHKVFAKAVMNKKLLEQYLPTRMGDEE